MTATSDASTDIGAQLREQLALRQADPSRAARADPKGPFLRRLRRLMPR